MIHDDDKHGEVRGAEEIMRVVWCPRCEMYELEINADTKRLGDVSTEKGMARLLEALSDARDEIEEFESLIMELVTRGCGDAMH
jgi:hypothetical protein